jgi:tetratricopeptide (TPR) repeat protein
VPLTGEVDALCEAMVAELAGRGDSRLIVFDGAQEHLALLGMLLPTLLARTEIRVVLTSRVRLRIPEEEVLEVAPLDEGATLALLAQRVEVAVGHDRTRTEELRCLLPLIDGLPLMVELGAPRLRMLTPAQLLGRVRAGPGLLGPMVLEGVARLPPPQQTALQALAAFPYGVTLDVAEVLLAPFGDPLATLGALLDHSMVVRTQPNKGLPRFRVLWAVAKLVQEADPGQVVSAVVAEQAARWAGSDASRAVHRPGGGDLRRVLRGEFGQAEVWVHALERAENPDAACELALAFAHLMSWEGLHRAAIGLLCSLKAHTRLLSLAAEVGVRLQDAEAVDQMLKGAGDAASGAGDEARQTLAEMTVLLARDQCKRAAGPLQDLHLSFGPDPWMRGRVSIQEHLMFAKLGMTQEAEQVLGVLASQAEAADDDLLRILAAVCEGFHAFQSGEPDRAAFCYRQGLPLAIRLGHAEHEAGFHRRLALALQAAGDQEGARRARLQALSLTTPEINPDVQAHLLASEAEYLQRAGDMEQACAMSRRAAELTKRGTQYNTTMSVLHRVVVIGLFAEGEYPFHQQLDELEARARQQETASYRVTIHFVRGMLALAEGKTVRARELAHTASSACQAIIGMVDGAYSLGQVATLAVEAGDLELGQACLDRAIEAYTGEGWTRFFQDDPWVLRAKNGLQHTMREG